MRAKCKQKNVGDTKDFGSPTFVGRLDKKSCFSQPLSISQFLSLQYKSNNQDLQLRFYFSNTCLP